MMKPGKTVIIVDSVEDAIKFYSDRLGFDIVDLSVVEGGAALRYAELRRGKCFVIFRVPNSDEVVEFAQIKYAAMRGTGLFVELKKGIEKYYNRCKHKGATILEPLRKSTWGYTVFSLKDPFGFRIMFGEPIAGHTISFEKFCGITLETTKSPDAIVDDIIRRLRNFGLSQRSSKKFAKSYVKNMRAS